eukprot:jgi/Tetstr1/436570/TSEL_025367.t2
MYATQSTSSRYGAALKDSTQFDAKLFSLSDAEASLIDPQQRMLTETTFDAVMAQFGTASGISGAQQRYGIYIGIFAAEYATVVHAAKLPQSSYAATASTSSVAAGRLSFWFNAKGPSIAMDTACSSSLVATHVCSNHLHLGEISGGVVSGVHLLFNAGSISSLCAAGMLSPSGRCQALSGDADGYVRGEAAISMVLQTCGVSSFAYQGTNAHAVVQHNGMGIEPIAASSSLTSWRKERHWVPAVEGFMLTQTAQALQIGVSLKIEMIGSVGVSRHANIHDHQVQGVTLFPGTGFMLGTWMYGVALGALRPASSITGVAAVVGCIDKDINPIQNVPHLEAATIAQLDCTLHLGDPGPPGGDFSGLVYHSSADSKWTRGEAVFGLALGSLGSHVLVKDGAVTRKPSHLSFEGAASCPTVFVTVDAALRTAAGALGLGDSHGRSASILVHAAAGGVGLAACQLAQAHGLRTVVTAGSPSKRAVARANGSAHASDSRSYTFVEELFLAQAGQGSRGPVAALNSLTSPGMVAATLSSLSTGAAFVEIAKRDIFSVARIAQERPDVRYQLLAVDFMPEEILQIHMEHVGQGLASGQLKPLANVCHNFNSVATALRQMSQAQHVGKVVVTRHTEAAPYEERSTVAISGGTGMLGQLMGGWLLQMSVNDVMLVSRTGRLATGNSDSLLNTAGTVTILQSDLACASDSQHAKDDACNTGPAVHVMHAGGVLADATIANQTASGVRKVFGPKVAGLLAWQQQLAGCAVGSQVLFSSIAALWGSPGQLQYSAANSVLDGLAGRWQAEGRAAVSVNWGAWAGGGMAAGDAGTAVRMERMGIGMVRPEAGLAALGEILTHSSKPQVAVSPTIWSRFVTANKMLPMFEDITAGLGTEDLELRNSLQSRLGTQLPATLLFDYPTVQDIAGYLQQSFASQLQRTAPAPAADPATLSLSAIPERLSRDWSTLGITSIGCRLPYDSPQGVALDAVSTVPLTRWRLDLSLETESLVSPTRFGCFLPHDVAQFDADAMRISAVEATFMDPQQRLLLHITAEAISAGLTSDTQGALDCGVFVGIWLADYFTIMNQSGSAISPYHATGITSSVAAGRLSYTFGLKGPCVAMDTACSASLVAVHLAGCAVQERQCPDGAAAAGVNLILVPETYRVLGAASLLSDSGRCKALDESGDGYGEACIVFMVQDMSSSESSGLLAFAALAGSAVNQDGRSSALTAPNGPSQQAVIMKAWAAAQQPLAGLECLNMHGTGTALGDPIEVGALSAVLNSEKRAGHVTLQACKSMFGHSEASAGTAGLMFTCIEVSLGKALDLVHLRNLNPHLEPLMSSSSVGVKLLATRQSNPFCGADNTIRSGLSSFAYQGTNVHVVVQRPSNKFMDCHVKPNAMISASFIPRMVPLISSRTMSHDAPSASPDSGTCLISGGMGMLGSLVARWLLQQHRQQRVVLLGRSGRMAQGGGWTEDGKLEHGRVDLYGCDLGNKEELRSTMQGALQGGVDVMHAGGVLADATIANQSAAGVRKVFGPKVAGLLAWQQQLAGYAVGSQVLFSSIAALWGSPGQLQYSAANSVLDGLAGRWQAEGRAAVSVNWGAWAGGGMAAGDAGTAVRMERMGIGMVRPEEGLAALGEVVRGMGARAALAVTPLDWDTFVRCMKPCNRHVYGGMPEQHEEKQEGHSYQEKAWRPPAQTPTAKRAPNVDFLEEVALQVQEILGTEVDPVAPLAQAGLDSLGALELRSALESALSVTLPATLLFDYPTIQEICGYLESQIREGDAMQETLAPPMPPPLATADSNVAVIGSSWRLPMPAVRLVRQPGQTTDCITTVPLQRWDLEQHGISSSGNTSTRWAAFLEMQTLERFDTTAYGMSKNEALVMDPQQRVLLELGTELMQQQISAKEYTSPAAARTGTGVYVGLYPPEYTRVVEEANLPVSAYYATGSTSSAAAGRLSFTLGANGPCVSMDTACSSSLIGVHFAEVQLRSGECNTALGLGCNVILKPGVLQILAAANMLSPRGRCAAIDATADGYVRGETFVGVMVALTGGGESVHALIAGSAINQDGRSSSLTSPHGPSQKAVMHAAWSAAGLRTIDMEMYQGHLTGTSLGDPIEVGALTAVVEGASRDAPCSLQGCKSAVGHSEPAAGLLGFLYLTQDLVQQSLRPMLHLRSVNPHLRLMLAMSSPSDKQASTFVPRATGSQAMAAPGGVSSFAYQGSNVHSVVSRGAGTAGAAVTEADAAPDASGVNLEGIFSAVMDEVTSVLELDVNPDESLAKLGLDSIGSVELRNRLQTLAGRELPAVVVFDYPTVRALSDHIAGIHASKPIQASMALVPSTLDGDRRGAFILATQNVQSWEVALAGRDLLATVPVCRWDEGVQAACAGGGGEPGLTGTAAAWIDGVQQFDPDAFGISVYEAVGMDPMQRLLLEQAGQVLASSGLHVGLDSLDVGVFVGIPGAGDFSSLCTSLAVPQSSYTATGIIASVASGRLSFTFNLVGPSVSVDTACSSSLVALSQATECIAAGGAAGALAAGAMLILVPQSSHLLQLGGILSEEGRCKVLDASTDGYARGEDVAAALLWSQYADPPVAAGSQPVGLLLAHAVNNDGASSSLTAPYGPAQRALMLAALGRAGLAPEAAKGCHLSCNGSNLGDVIEFGAVRDVFLEGAIREDLLPLLSIKPATGHQEAASGAAVLSAVTRLLEAGQLPPLMHLRSLNPHVSSLNGAALLPRSATTPWQAPATTLACGINSFALQGTNAHVLVGAADRAFVQAPRFREVLAQRQACWPVATSYVLAPGVKADIDIGRLRFSWRIQPATAEALCGCQQGDLRTMPPGVMVAAAAAAVAAASQRSNVESSSTLLTRLLQHVGAKQDTAAFETLVDAPSGALCIEGISSKSREHLRCQVVTRARQTLGIALLPPSPATSTACILRGPELLEHTVPEPVATAAVEAGWRSLEEVGFVVRPGEVEAATQLSSVLQLALHTPPLEGMWGVLREAAALGVTPAPHRVGPLPLAAFALQHAVTGAGLDMSGVLLDEYQLLEGSDTEDFLQRSSKQASQAAEPPIPSALTAILEAAASTDLSAFIESVVIDTVEGILGVIAGDDDNLYEAGMDSRAGIELRNLLSETTGLDLPSSLLYENPTVRLLSAYLGTEIAKHQVVDKEPSGLDQTSLVVGQQMPHDALAIHDAGNTAQGNADAQGADLQWGDGTGNGHTVLRTLTEPSPTPIFFIAPLAVGGQRAYYNFARQFLSWTRPNPLYSLDHDTLGGPSNLKSMASMHIDDMLSVNSSGPVILAGQSLGGMTSMEVALQAQARGLKMGLMMIFDSPLPCQVTPISEDPLNDDDLLATIEDGLGTLGCEMLGLGPRNMAIKDTPKWRRMSKEERFNFFRDWWSKLSGEELQMAEIKDFIGQWASANKFGVGDDDVRHHVYSSRLTEETTTLYFRAMTAGALGTFMDSNHNEHGTIWTQHCSTVEIIDVPGNHFTLLGQDEEEMEVMMEALKIRLAPCGIGTDVAVQPGVIARNNMVLKEAASAFTFMEDCGVPYFERLRTLQGSLPSAIPGDGVRKVSQPLGANGPSIEVLNWRLCKDKPQVPPLVLLHDGTGHVPPGLREIGANIRSRGVYAMDLPAEAARMKNEWQADKHGSLENLADLYCQALATEFGEEGQFVLLGTGVGGLLAYQTALQMRAAYGDPAVPPLVLLPEPLDCVLAGDAGEPWFRLWPMVAAQAKHALGDQAIAGRVLDVFRNKCAALKAEGQTFLEFLDGMAPEGDGATARQWHAKLWVAAGGDMATAREMFSEQELAGAAGGAWEGCRAERDKLQWMAVHRFLRSMGTPLLPSFSELLADVRLYDDLTEQLAFVGSFQPDGLPEFVWMEQMHGSLLDSELLLDVSKQVPADVPGQSAFRGVVACLRLDDVARSAPQHGVPHVGHFVPEVMRGPSLQATLKISAAALGYGGLRRQQLSAAAAFFDELVPKLLTCVKRSLAARSNLLARGRQGGILQDTALSPAPRMLSSRKVLPLNRLAAGSGPGGGPASLAPPSPTPAPRPRLFGWAAMALRQLHRGGRQGRAARTGLAPRAELPLPVPPGLAGAPPMALPVWWAREPGGSLPPGLAELCRELGAPAMALPALRRDRRGVQHPAGQLALSAEVAGGAGGAAGRQVAALRALQPAGPYVIAGAGGACGEAVALAAAMSAQGLEVTLLLLRGSAADVAAGGETTLVEHLSGAGLPHVPASAGPEVDRSITGRTGTEGSGAVPPMGYAGRLATVVAAPRQASSSLAEADGWEVLPHHAARHVVPHRCLQLPVDPLLGAAVLAPIRRAIAAFILDVLAEALLLHQQQL